MTRLQTCYLAALAAPSAAFAALRLAGVVNWSWWMLAALISASFLTVALVIGFGAVASGEGRPVS